MPNSSILGEPNEGIHAYRVPIGLGDVAVVDVALTVFAAWVVARLTNKSLWAVLLVFFILGIVAHRIFGVRTTVDKLLFPNA